MNRPPDFTLRKYDLNKKRDIFSLTNCQQFRTHNKTSSIDERQHTMATETQHRSRRACSDPIGNGTGESVASDYKGCGVCANNDKYGFGSSVCGRCNRCHDCGSSNNGIGPFQAVYLGGKKVVQKAFGSKEVK
ncbi:hypothetical protein AC579_6830 [Pseudocercospora musae]|uniref:Uncharacterized protein n=1 Tax=Pseudocercospora musae TaxID=113226 RepID=A0A139IPX0_9PEZI|nr:hypothetical protein AC579_6830 [Pseudocercospora musae]